MVKKHKTDKKQTDTSENNLNQNNCVLAFDKLFNYLFICKFYI